MECQGLPGIPRSCGGVVSLSEPPKETHAANIFTSYFGLLTMREEISVALNYPAGSTLGYGSSRKRRQPIICLSKSNLNLKVWVLPLLLPPLRKMHPGSKLFPQKHAQPYVYLSLSCMEVVIFPVHLRAHQGRKLTHFFFDLQWLSVLDIIDGQEILTEKVKKYRF